MRNDTEGEKHSVRADTIGSLRDAGGPEGAGGAGRGKAGALSRPRRTEKITLPLSGKGHSAFPGQSRKGDRPRAVPLLLLSDPYHSYFFSSSDQSRTGRSLVQRSRVTPSTTVSSHSWELVASWMSA